MQTLKERPSIKTSKDHANVAVFPPLPFALAAGVGVLAHVLWEPFRFFPEFWIGHAAGWPLVLAAAVLVVWAQRTMAGAGESSNVYKPNSAIVSTGPYAFTRNPMYLSLTLLCGGISLIVNTVWPIVLLPAVLMVIHHGVIRREERYLERKFGDVYRQYRARVRRWL